MIFKIAFQSSCFENVHCYEDESNANSISSLKKIGFSIDPSKARRNTTVLGRERNQLYFEMQRADYIQGNRVKYA